MNTEKVNHWLTLLANIGVLIGIIFLAVEVRLSNRIAIAATEISVRDQFRTLNETVLANDAVAELLVKAADIDAEMSAVETEKLYAYLYAHINIWMSIEIAYENGMLPRTTFEASQADIGGVLLAYPALKAIARDTMYAYPSNRDSRVFAAMREALEDVD